MGDVQVAYRARRLWLLHQFFQGSLYNALSSYNLVYLGTLPEFATKIFRNVMRWKDAVPHPSCSVRRLLPVLKLPIL